MYMNTEHSFLILLALAELETSQPAADFELKTVLTNTLPNNGRQGGNLRFAGHRNTSTKQN